MAPKKILLADDDRELNEELTEILTGEGYQVTPVFIGNEALAKALAEDFDIILLDFKMPGMDGICVLKELKKAGKPVKVIIMSGKPFIERLSDEPEYSGMLISVLPKPFEIEALLSAINS